MKIVDPASRCKTCPWYYDSRALMKGKGLCKRSVMAIIDIGGRAQWPVVEEGEFCEEHPEFQIIEVYDTPMRRAIDDALKDFMP